VDASCFGWVGLFQDAETFAEARCIFMGDGEDTDAALGAAGAADEMRAAAAVGVGYCGIDDLDEGLRHGNDVEGSRVARCPHLRIEIWGTQRAFVDTDSSGNFG
jgi:hypothetical protein